MSVFYIPCSFARGALNYWFYRKSWWWGERKRNDQLTCVSSSVPMNFRSLRKRILIWTSWIWANHSGNWSWKCPSFSETEDWCRSTYFWHVPSPHACQDVERHQSSFQIFKTWAWGEDSESHHLKRNTLRQVFSTPRLPLNWHVRYSREGGSFM